MFELYADKVKLSVQRREAVTSGSVNVYRARFGFSRHWDGLEKTAIFQAGDTVVSVLLDENGECAIPWEALSAHGVELLAAVYGARASGEIVLPTAWASLGVILKGAEPGETARPPTPDLWQQELDRKGDALDYTESGELGLYAGGKLLSAVPVKGGGGGPSWGVGHGLKVVDGNLAVNSVSDFKGDNTLPMTAAGVVTVVGNIEALLGTI